MINAAEIHKELFRPNIEDKVKFITTMELDFEMLIHLLSKNLSVFD